MHVAVLSRRGLNKKTHTNEDFEYSVFFSSFHHKGVC